MKRAVLQTCLLLLVAPSSSVPRPCAAAGRRAPVVLGMARRRPHGSAGSRHPARRSSTTRSPTSTSRCRSSSNGIGRRRKRCFSLEKYLVAQLTPKTHPRRPRDRLASIASCSIEVGERYGVPPRIIAGIWGMESNFGRFSGMRPTVAGAGDAGVGSAPRDVLSRRAVRRARDPQPRRHRSGPAARLVGRRDGPGPVHAVELPEVRRGLRRRRPPRYLVDASRRLRVDRQLSQGPRLGALTRPGDARSAVAGGRAPDRRRRRAAQRQLSATRDMTVALPLRALATSSASGLPGGKALPKPRRRPRRSCRARRATFSSIRTTTRCSTTTARIRTRSASPCSAMPSMSDRAGDASRSRKQSAREAD